MQESPIRTISGHTTKWFNGMEFTYANGQTEGFVTRLNKTREIAVQEHEVLVGVTADTDANGDVASLTFTLTASDEWFANPV